jgi:hypothetical protein
MKPATPMLDGHEQVLLSAMMNGHADLPIHEDDFASQPNRTIYRCLTSPTNRGLLAVQAELKQRGQLEAVGGPARLTDISCLPHDPANLKYALGEVLEASRQRRAMRIFQDGVAGKITVEEASTKLEAIQKPVNGAVGLTILTPAEIFALPKDEYANILGDRVAAKGQSVVISGQPSVGKTPLTLQLLVAINTKRTWCGLETHGEPLCWLYLQNENSRDRLEKDLAAFLKWAPNFDQSKLHVQVYRTEDDGFLSLDDRKAVANIEKAINDIQPNGIVCDPLRDFGIGDLNSDQDMIATLRELSRLARLGNPDRLLVILHHALTGRAGAQKAFGLDRVSFARNSKALLGWARAQINVAPASEDSNEQLVLTCGRNSNGKEFPPVAVRRNEDGIYEVDEIFDIESWREHVTSKTNTRTPPVEKVLRKLLQPGHDYDKAQMAALIRKDKGVSNATAYRWIDQGEASRILRFNRKTETYVLT